MLEVVGLHSGYGDVTVVHGISLRVGSNEVVSIVGSNGAGKTTTLRTISGLLPVRGGEVRFMGESIVGLPPGKIVERGIAHVPEGRQLFTNMSVEENLDLGGYIPTARAGKASRLDFVYSLFPRLAERRSQNAGTLSGGEQQMVAIGRGLMLSPRLLVLDEPSLGLSPLLVQTMFETVDQVKAEGVSILLVEQNLVQSLQHSDHAYVMETGEIVIEGESQELLADPRTRQAYLGLYDATNQMGD